MRKFIAILLAVMLVAPMTVTAHAVTPKLNIPDVPQISNIKLDIKLDESMEKAIENYATKWVEKIDFSKIKFNFGD